VIKPVKDLEKEEKCPTCDFVMRRLVSKPASIYCDNFEPEYYHAFGKKINSKRELQNEIVRIKHETGKEVHQIGNDSMKTFKRERKPLPSTREVMEREKWT
jgi:hypothetical protein